MKPQQKDPVKKSDANQYKKTYKGVRQGFETKHIVENERLENDIENPKIGIWTEEDFEPQQVSINHQYYCVKCKDFMHLMGVKDIFACTNSMCEFYLKFINIKEYKPPQLIDIDMKEISEDSDDEPWITSISPDKLNEKYTLYDKKTVEYSSPDGRIQRIVWRGYPKEYMESGS